MPITLILLVCLLTAPDLTKCTAVDTHYSERACEDAADVLKSTDAPGFVACFRVVDEVPA